MYGSLANLTTNTGEYDSDLHVSFSDDVDALSKLQNSRCAVVWRKVNRTTSRA